MSGSSDGPSAFHRYGGEYVETGRGETADIARRIRLALGPEPVEDARYLLPPLGLPPSPLAEAPGPHPGTQFVVDLLGNDPVTGERASVVLLDDRNRAALDFPRVWGRPVGHDAWTPLESAHPSTRFSHLTLGWDLTARPGENAPDLARADSKKNSARMKRSCHSNARPGFFSLNPSPVPRWLCV